MRNADRWLFSKNEWRQLRTRMPSPANLAIGILSVMTANLPVLKARHVRKFAHLEAIPGGEHDSTAPFFQFLDNGRKNGMCGEFSKSIQIFGDWAFPSWRSTGPSPPRYALLLDRPSAN